MSERYDVAILGAGPGGYVAALRAAQLGAKVAPVEKKRVGGTCLNVGCIPTKALTTATNVLVDARRGQDFGLTIPEVKLDLPALMAYERETVDNLVSGVERLLDEREVTLVRGEGRLVEPDTLRVTGQHGGTTTVSGEHVILAPGGIEMEGPFVAAIRARSYLDDVAGLAGRLAGSGAAASRCSSRRCGRNDWGTTHR